MKLLTVRYVVLLVEDDVQQRAALKDHFVEADYDVIEAGDGVEALRALTQFKVHAVVTDLMMPNMGGWALVETMAADFGLRDVPVVIVTGVPEEAREGRLYTFIKPFETGRLLRTVDVLVGRSTSQVVPHYGFDVAP